MKPSNQRLYKDREELKNDRTLSDYGFNAGTAKPQSPGTIGLAFRCVNLNESGHYLFEVKCAIIKII